MIDGNLAMANSQQYDSEEQFNEAEEAYHNGSTLRQEGIYILMAYRYGHREGHGYIVDLCGGIDTAKERAEEEANERGGKYSVVVWAKNKMSGEMEEIYEAKCPEQYTKNTHPFIANKDHENLMISFATWIQQKYEDIQGIDIQILYKTFLEENV